MRNCGNFRNGVKHLYIQFFGLSDDIRSFGVCSFSFSYSNSLILFIKFYVVVFFSHS